MATTRETRTEFMAFHTTPTTKERVVELAQREELPVATWLNRLVSAVAKGATEPTR